MKRKITIDCGSVGYWEVEDYSDHYDDIVYEIGEEKAGEYFRAGEFTKDFVDKCNGKHFLYGYFERLFQSDYCPLYLFEGAEIKKVVVEEN